MVTTQVRIEHVISCIGDLLLEKRYTTELSNIARYYREMMMMMMITQVFFEFNLCSEQQPACNKELWRDKNRDIIEGESSTIYTDVVALWYSCLRFLLLHSNASRVHKLQCPYFNNHESQAMSIVESGLLGQDTYLLSGFPEKSTRDTFLDLVRARIGSYKRCNIIHTIRHH